MKEQDLDIDAEIMKKKEKAEKEILEARADDIIEAVLESCEIANICDNCVDAYPFITERERKKVIDWICERI